MSSATLTRHPALSSLDDWDEPHLLSDADLAAEMQWLTQQLRLLDFDWLRHARPEQLEPDHYTTWFIKAGRGYGKTRTGAETVRKHGEMKPLHIAVIAKANRELRDICFESRRAGLTNVIPAEQQERYYKGIGDTRLVLTNGTVFRGFSAEDPDALRGYEFDMVWLDEYATYAKRVAQDVYDQAWFCMRESPRPRMIVTSTPKRLQHVIDLIERSKTEPGVVVTHGHTLDNKQNLSPAALKELLARYEGTRTGRQELGGELLEDVEGALWPLELIESSRWVPPEPEDGEQEPPSLPLMRQIITAVDPSGSEDGDATGIVTSGITVSDVVFVLADDTTKGTPEHRYETACLAAHREGASMILYEGAYGADNIAYGLRNAWEHLVSTGKVSGQRPAIQPSNIAGDKVRRAEPVVALYEQHAAGTERIWHAVPLPLLEDEQTTWEPDAGWSPNRIDAMVHGVRRLTRHLGVGVTLHSPTQDRPPQTGTSRWSRPIQGR